MPKAVNPKPRATRKAASSTKSKKDPNQPKRALSAYMFFANEERPKVLKENPEYSFGQIGKLLGVRWKGLSPEERKPYEKKALDDKKRYESQKAAYTAKPQSAGEEEEEEEE